MDPSGSFSVELLGLGHCDLASANRDVSAVLAQQKRFGLLAYLVLARPRGAHQRDKLLALFWPALSEDKARHSLAQALYFLRKKLGRAAIVANGSSLVGVGVNVTSDVQRFETLLESNEIEEALSLYKGELLPGLHVTECRDFEVWLDGERRRLKGMAKEGALTLAAALQNAGDLPRAVGWARWAGEHAAFDEDVITTLLLLLGDSGDASDLRRQFDRYSSRLRQDLGIEPSTRVREAFAEASRRAAGQPLPRKPSRQDSHTVNDSVVSAPARPGKRSPVLVAVAIGVLLGLGAYLTSQTEMSATNRHVVAIVAFDVQGDSPELNNVARLTTDWVSREIARSGIVETIVPAAASPRDASPAGDSAPFSWEHGESQEGLVVSGVVYTDSSGVAIDVMLVEMATDRVVLSIPGARGAEKDPVGAAQDLARRIAGGLATVVDPRFGRWAEVASQPPSIEAYRAFLSGLDALATQQSDSAYEYFLHAARMDPEFTAPLVWAVRNRVDAHRQAQADSIAQNLVLQRDDMAPWDRAMLDYYVAYLRGTWEEAYQAAHQVEFVAPDPEWTHLVASSAQAANRPEAALTALARLAEGGEWMRRRPFAWRSWAFVHHDLGQYEEELAVARARSTEHPGAAAMAELGALAGLGRLSELRSRLETTLDMMSGPMSQLRILTLAVDELRAHGHTELAQELAERAVLVVDSVVAEGDTTAEIQHVRGRHLYLARRWTEAYELLASLDSADQGDPFKTLLGAAAARVGNEEEARAVAAGLLRDDPLGKGHETYLAAKVIAAVGDQAEATRLLRRAISEGFGFYPWLHTVQEWENLRGYEPFDALMTPKG